MENSILNLLPFDAGILILALFAVLLISIIILIIALVKSNQKIKKLTEKYEAFMKGRNAESLEDRLMSALTEIDRLNKVQKVQKTEMGKLDHRVKKSYQKIGLIKYNGFAGMGGMSSFALTLLDETDNGFILNAIHSREGCYTYIKEIVKGESYIVLGQEEKDALRQAVNYLGDM